MKVFLVASQFVETLMLRNFVNGLRNTKSGFHFCVFFGIRSFYLSHR